MNTLKPCPFCGGEATENRDISNSIYCKKCFAEIDTDCVDWNTRPIEDALHARIAALKGAIEILVDQQHETKNILIDKDLHIDSLYEEGYKMQQRIAELEAENIRLGIEYQRMRLALGDIAINSKRALNESPTDHLIVHSDIERQDDKSPNDTQTQAIVYGKESEECSYSGLAY